MADQSKQSAVHIEEIVTALLSNVDTNVVVTKEVSEAFLKQNEKIKETEVIFTSLNEEIGKVNGSIHEIADEVEGLNSYKEVLEAEGSSLTVTAQQNADSAGVATENVEEFSQIVAECSKTTEIVVSVSEELIGYIAEFGEDAVKEKIAM